MTRALILVVVALGAGAAVGAETTTERGLGFSILLPGDWKRVPRPDGRTVDYLRESGDGPEQVTVSAIRSGQDLTPDQRRLACKTLADERRSAERQAMGAAWQLGPVVTREEGNRTVLEYDGAAAELEKRSRSVILCTRKGAWAFLYGRQRLKDAAFRSRADAILRTADVER